MKVLKDKRVLCAIILFAAFLLLILLLKTVDVKPIGPEGSKVGFAALNGGWFNLTGVHKGWYNLTQALGYVAIALVVLAAVMGLLQLIKRKSFFKVDGDILVLGGLFIAIMFFYIVFNILKVNYRPVILNVKDGLEASFPSSHTMLAVSVFAALIPIFQRRIKNRNIKLAVTGVLALLMVLTIVGRLVCGVHWFTDILGGLLLSASLVLLYMYFSEVVLEAQRRERRKNNAG